MAKWDKASRVAWLSQHYLKNFPRTFAAGPPKQYTYQQGSPESRKQLLRTVYQPFANLIPNSPEYDALAKSCAAWKDYFHPFDLTEVRHWQTMHPQPLLRIDELKERRGFTLEDFSDALQVSLSHQSVQIEGYTLGQGDSEAIYEALKHATNSFTDPNMYENPPSAEKLMKDAHLQNKADVIMFRNNILAQQFGFRVLGKKLFETDLKDLHRLILKDTHMEKNQAILTFQNGKAYATVIGDYRVVAMQAKGTHHTIYPYPPEVPALMIQLIDQHNCELATPSVHPLLYYCHLYATLLHIHPFHDGNGRIARLLFASALARLGYMPPAFQSFDRNDYLEALFLYDQKQPYSWLSMLCDAVLFSCGDEDM